MKKPQSNINLKPIFYATFFLILREIAIKYGYALGLHGTMTRDLDIIAIPWIESPGDEMEMLREMQLAVSSEYQFDKINKPEDCEKPHGRRAYIIPVGMGGYIDISVMPKTNKQKTL